MTDIRSLLVEHIPHLRRYAWSLLRNREEADDLVQECLVRAIAKQHSFRPGTNLRAWLFTILHNHYVDIMRGRKNLRFSLTSEDIPAGASVEPNQIHFLDLQRLSTALGRLPLNQKTALLLVSLEGMSYEETAEITGVAVGTVKSRVSRARETLRHWISHDLPSSEQLRRFPAPAERDLIDHST